MPYTITAYGSGYFRTSLVEMSGSEVRKPLLSTSSSMESDEKSKVSCNKDIR